MLNSISDVSVLSISAAMLNPQSGLCDLLLITQKLDLRQGFS